MKRKVFLSILRKSITLLEWNGWKITKTFPDQDGEPFSVILKRGKEEWELRNKDDGFRAVWVKKYKAKKPLPIYPGEEKFYEFLIRRNPDYLYERERMKEYWSPEDLDEALLWTEKMFNGKRPVAGLSQEEGGC